MIKKYLELTDNLLLTDYCQFLWIKEGLVVKEFQFCNINVVGNRNAKLEDNKAFELEVLITDFLSVTPQGITNAKDLAKALALRTKSLKDFLFSELSNTNAEENIPRLLGLFQSFQSIVASDLTHSEFAVAYAQMMTYGLFLAKLNADTQKIHLHSIKHHIPKSFELIKELTGFLDELEDSHYQPIQWIIEEILTILNNVDLPELQKSLSFNNALKNSDSEHFADPYLYFYEDFLGEYDPELRKKKGVYYTPPSVVNFIVRAIDEVLKKDFEIKDGIANPDKVTVLDFATGTGTFLLEIVRLILNPIDNHSPKFTQIIQNHILKNIYGFEYMIASYTIAHLKISQYLHENGYDLKEKERLQIFLTNTLEPLNSQMKYDVPSLSREGIAAQNVKRQPILVITGNPPYSGHSGNKGIWISERVNEYKRVGDEILQERNPKWLQDDYVKFIRFAEWKMQQVEEGIVAIITNHSFLDNPTFRLMRKSLMNTFNHLYILDLHGNSKKKETSLDGSKDQNVFEIMQDVSISIFVKRKNLDKKVFHADFYGTRKSKFEACLQNDLNSINWSELSPQKPHYLFVPQDKKDLEQYESGWSVKDIFNLNSVGIVTSKDDLLIDQNEKTLKDRILDFKKSEDVRMVREKFNLSVNFNEKIEKTLRNLKVVNFEIKRIAYRPFDNRYIWWETDFIERSRDKVMEQFDKENIALAISRQFKSGKTWQHIYLTEFISESTLVSNKTSEITCVFPLFYYNGNGNVANGNGYLFNEEGKKDNFTVEFRKFIKQKYTIAQKNDTSELENIISQLKELIRSSEDNLEETINLGLSVDEQQANLEMLKSQLLTKENELQEHNNQELISVPYHPEPREIFDYMYAILHSKSYREKYVGFLKMDFPKIPFTDDVTVFQTLALKGHELAEAHLLNKIPAYFVGEPFEIKDNIVTETRFSNNRLYFNDIQYFENVSQEVWEFQIGGYRVLEKYLKDRKDQNIANEFNHIQNIIKVLTFTLDQMNEIEEMTKEWIQGDFFEVSFILINTFQGVEKSNYS